MSTNACLHHYLYVLPSFTLMMRACGNTSLAKIPARRQVGRQGESKLKPFMAISWATQVPCSCKENPIHTLLFTISSHNSCQMVTAYQNIWMIYNTMWNLQSFALFQNYKSCLASIQLIILSISHKCRLHPGVRVMHVWSWLFLAEESHNWHFYQNLVHTCDWWLSILRL